MSENLLKVSKGLKLVYIGLMLVVVAMVLGIVGGILIGVGGAVAAQGAGRGGGANAAAAIGVPMIIVFGLVGLLAFAGNIVGLVGRFFCLATPPEAHGARSKIILSVIFEVCALLNGIVNNLDQLTLNFLPPAAKMVSSGFGVLASIAAVVLFLLFARSLAEFIRRKRLGEDAMSVLYLFALTFICYLIGVVVMVGGVFLAGGGGAGGAGGGAAAGGACIGGILSIAALIVGIVSLVKYAKLLTNLSDATRKFARTIDDDRYDDDEADDDYRPRRRDDDDADYEEPEDDLDEDRGRRRRRN